MPTRVKLPVFGSTDELIFQVLKKFFEGQDVHVGTLYSEDLKPPLVIARRERRSGGITESITDDRFMQSSLVSVSTIAEGVDADTVAEELQEAVRIALRQAQLDQVVIPDGGSITRITNSTVPSRVSDYATSTGVVQYASLPQGQVRYEAIYRLIVRPPNQSTITNRFLSPRLF